MIISHLNTTVILYSDTLCFPVLSFGLRWLERGAVTIPYRRLFLVLDDEVAVVGPSHPEFTLIRQLTLVAKPLLKFQCPLVHFAHHSSHSTRLLKF